MIERKDKRYVSCPVCGRLLMKCDGQCSIDITCGKCGSDIVVVIDNNRVMVLENRRSPGKNDKEGQVRISVSKAKNSRLIEQKKIAVNG
ncbi:hypothetical protein [Catonella morbi]|nr:hypothetical protein [Catonella morbi]